MEKNSTMTMLQGNSVLPSKKRPSMNFYYRMAMLTAAFALLVSLATFENIADLKYHLRFRLPFWLWKQMMYRKLGGRDAAHADGARNFETRPCSDIHMAHTAQTPILFKKCIAVDQGVTSNDFLFFTDHQQNMFPSCGDHDPVKDFQYTSFEGQLLNASQLIPCRTNQTLQDMATDFYSRLQVNNKEKDSEETTTTSKFDASVFIRALVPSERAILTEKLKQLMPSSQGGLDIRQMAVPLLVYLFLHSGPSFAYYFHAHFDRFVSFCVEDTKIWYFIDPLYVDNFEYAENGFLDIVLTKEKTKSPVLTIVQEPGDVLLCPNYWFHSTRAIKGKKNFGLNLSFGAKRQVMWVAGDAFLYFGSDVLQYFNDYFLDVLHQWWT